jgi:hypothetical protein
MATLEVPYAVRWGHPRTRTLRRHPKRQARRERAYKRGAPRPKAKS